MFKNKQVFIVSFISFLVMIFIGCGGGGSSKAVDEPQTQIKQGTVYDDVVVGLDYKTEGFTSKTNEAGKFDYKNGKVEFFLGKLKVGEISSITQDKKVFLTDMLNLKRGDYSNPKLIKLARLLQSLDTNKNDEIISLNAKKINELFTKQQILADVDITKLDLVLVSIEAAQEELKQTYIKEGVALIEEDGDSANGSTGGSGGGSILEQTIKANAGDDIYTNDEKIRLNASKSTITNGTIINYKWLNTDTNTTIYEGSNQTAILSANTLSKGENNITLIITSNTNKTSTDSLKIFYNTSNGSSSVTSLGFQGYGAKSKGGRGGIIYKVTNLEWNDQNGSLKYGLYDLKVPRIIVFDVSGVINVPEGETGHLTAENSYVTVAGQTSEGGITLRMEGGESIALRSYNLNYNDDNPILYPKDEQFHDAIFQNLRFRGTNNTDNLSIAGVYNIIIDHCDFSGAEDEALDITYAQDVTIQNTTIANAMGKYGFILAYHPTTNISFHHNLTANLMDRCFAHIHWGRKGTPSSGANIDVRNNVGYNCWHESFLPIIVNPKTANTNGIVNMNFQNNHFIVGPNSAGPNSPTQTNIDGGTETHTSTGMIGISYGENNVYENQEVSIYANGNLFPDSDTAHYPSGQRPLFPLNYEHINLTNQPFNFPKVTTQSASEAKTKVMAEVGAWPRDAMNLRTINQINTLTGGFRDINASLLNNSTPSLTDSDNDGMADSWESANGLQVGVNDSALDKDNDGITNIEEYLHYKMQDMVGK